jgi:hypothetical protein
MNTSQRPLPLTKTPDGVASAETQRGQGRRVAIVQGPSQLIDLLSVFRYHQETEPTKVYEDILLIGGTCAGLRQGRRLADACRQLAPLWPFHKIVDIHHLEWLYRYRLISFIGAVAKLRKLIGQKPIQKVLTCRNGQFINELVLSAFSSADKICYGDCGAIDLGSTCGEKIYNPAGLFTVSKSFVSFPRLFYDNLLDTLELCILPCRHYLSVINDASTLPAVRKTLSRSNLSESGQMVLVLTSNLVENGTASSVQDEIDFYVESVLPFIEKKGQVLIKGHPRETFRQSERLLNRLTAAGFPDAAIIRSSNLPIDCFAASIKVKRVITLGSSGGLPFALSQGSEIVVGVDKELEQRYLKTSVNGLQDVYSRIIALQVEQAYAKHFDLLRFEEVQQMSWTYSSFPNILRPTG